MNTTRQSAFENLPDEMLVEFIENLNPKGIARLCQTDKRFAGICRDDNLWGLKIRQRWPLLPREIDPKLLGATRIIDVYLSLLKDGDDIQKTFFISANEARESLRNKRAVVLY